MTKGLAPYLPRNLSDPEQVGTVAVLVERSLKQDGKVLMKMMSRIIINFEKYAQIIHVMN